MVNAWSITIYIMKKLKFSAQRSKKTRDFQKKLVFEISQNSLNT